MRRSWAESRCCWDGRSARPRSLSSPTVDRHCGGVTKLRRSPQPQTEGVDVSTASSDKLGRPSRWPGGSPADAYLVAVLAAFTVGGLAAEFAAAPHPFPPE